MPIFKILMKLLRLNNIIDIIMYQWKKINEH